MTNLIPERRADKNGKVVIRHVRSAATKRALEAIPSPSVASTVSREKRIDRILGGGLAVHSGIARTRLKEKLEGMEDSEFRRIESLIDNSDLYEGHLTTYQRFVKDVLDDNLPENRALYLNAIEALGIDDGLEDWADVRAMRMFRKIPEFSAYAEDLTQAPPEVMEKIKNLGRYRHEFGGGTFLYANTGTRFRLHSRELESIIINEPERAEKLIDWAGEHYARDTGRYLDSKMALMVINRPADRDGIAALIRDGITNSDIIELILNNPESRQEIVEYYDNGVTRAEAIRSIIKGEVKTTLASGVL